MAIAAAAVGLLGSVEARAGDASDGAASRVPLVWRVSGDAPRRIEVARHHRLRPEIDATAKARHRRGGHKADDSQPTQTVVVKKGDTINSIARGLHTTPKAIMDANPDLRPRAMKIGETIKAPAAASSSDKSAASDSGADTAPARGRHGRAAKAKAETSAPKSYVIKRGDTLYSIARRHGVTVAELTQANKLRSSSRLHAGQKIDLPGQPEEAAAPAETPPARTPKTSRHERPSRKIPPAASTQPAPSPSSAPPASTGVGPGQPIPYSDLSGTHPAPPPAAVYGPPPPPAYTPPAPTPIPSAPITEVPIGPTDAQVAAAGRGRFIWPVAGNVLSGFGPKPGGQRNDGVDIAAPDGAPVLASAAGDVVYAGNLVPGFGNLVLIKHEDGWVTAYAHLSKTEVKIKDHIVQGAEIGTVGSSGGVDQPQLHFEIRYAPSPRERARPIDPTLVLPAR
jgi:murein DD-endopeptidase MepM/ murein hydrolase activator NlpD